MLRGALKRGVASRNVAWGPQTWCGITKCCVGPSNVVWDHEMLRGALKCGVASRNVVRGPSNVVWHLETLKNLEMLQNALKKVKRGEGSREDICVCFMLGS